MIVRKQDVEDAVLVDQEDLEQTELSSSIEEAFNLDEVYGTKDMRWYQIAARNQAVFALKNGSKRILIVLPTGAGKTLTIAASLSFPEMREALGVPAGEKLRVLFIAHKHRLLSQAEETFAADSGTEIILQSAFSDLPPALLRDGWDITVIDEAHHEAMRTIQLHLELLGDKPIIGLTATPDRADGMVIKFDVIINPISREQAVEEGFLAETSIHTFVDVPSKDKLDILTDIFKNYAHQMGQTMVFVKTKKEVAAITLVLQSMGYKAVAVLSQTERQLDLLLNEFSEGKHQFIVNCNKINEGVDVRNCTDVVLGRQFGSYPQLNQVIGRAARPDSECNVWELINPLSGRNLDTTVIVGTPKFHRLISIEGGNWVEREFDYINHRTNKQLGIASGIRIRH